MKPPSDRGSEWSELERQMLHAARDERIPPELRARMHDAVHAAAAGVAARPTGGRLLFAKVGMWGSLAVIALGGAALWSSQYAARHAPAAVSGSMSAPAVAIPAELAQPHARVEASPAPQVVAPDSLASTHGTPSSVGSVAPQDSSAPTLDRQPTAAAPGVAVPSNSAASEPQKQLTAATPAVAVPSSSVAPGFEKQLPAAAPAVTAPSSSVAGLGARLTAATPEVAVPSNSAASGPEAQLTAATPAVAVPSSSAAPGLGRRVTAATSAVTVSSSSAASGLEKQLIAATPALTVPSSSAVPALGRPLAAATPTVAVPSGSASQVLGRQLRAAAPIVAKPASIQEELLLLDRARVAVRAHDVPGALGLLDDHARRFSTGVLQPEAQVLRIEALVVSGQTQRAQVLGRSFLRQYSDHPLAEHVSKLIARR